MRLACLVVPDRQPKRGKRSGIGRSTTCDPLYVADILGRIFKMA
jgi:hypothetical protein